jgi:hypothetical protein
MIVAFVFIPLFVTTIAIVAFPIYVTYYAYQNINSKFDKNDMLKAYVLSCLIHDALISIFINSIDPESWNTDAISFILYICIGFGSYKIVQEFRKETMPICKFFLGLHLSYRIITSLVYGFQYISLVNLVIGLGFTKVDFLTPFIIYILGPMKYSPLFLAILYLS